MRPRPLQSLIGSRLAILSWLRFAVRGIEELGDGKVAETSDTRVPRRRLTALNLNQPLA